MRSVRFGVLMFPHIKTVRPQRCDAVMLQKCYTIVLIKTACAALAYARLPTAFDTHDANKMHLHHLNTNKNKSTATQNAACTYVWKYALEHTHKRECGCLFLSVSCYSHPQ